MKKTTVGSGEPACADRFDLEIFVIPKPMGWWGLRSAGIAKCHK
ncbi:hypothetical protein [Anaerotignum sp.]|nr:hypothetical protein [Anaerotignum sp.]